jgi:alpha-galactosidase
MAYKIVVIGAGSFSFGTMTVRDIMEAPEMKGSEIVLVDLDAERLDRMHRLCKRLNETWQAEMNIWATTDRREALPGADIVVGAVERNRYPLWQMDIQIPRKHGCGDLYGENGGPGGFFHTLRQVPITLEIARDIEALCPDAWFIQMSNPESRLTLAVERYTDVKSVGVCLGAYITRRALAGKVLGIPEEEVEIKAAGINHCHWVMDIRHVGTGEDLYPAVREKIKSVDPSWQPFSRYCLERFGYFPGPADSHVGEYISWAEKHLTPGYNRWVFEADMEVARMTEKLEKYAGGSGPLTAEELEQFMVERGYKWQTMDIILSLLDGKNRYVLSANVPNDGYITNLNQDAVVEVPALVGADHIYGVGVGELPLTIASLMNRQLDVMDLNLEAAVTGDRKTALEGLMLDPLVPDPDIAEKVLDEMLIAQKDYLPQFK